MSGCIEPKRYKSPDGRYRVRRKGKYVLLYRVLWEEANGPIPDGLFLLHKCDNPSCVNLEHLFLGTQTDNMRDCSQKRRIAHGNRTGTSKLTEETAIYAMARLLVGEKQSDVAAAFGVQQMTMSKLWRGVTWGWLFQ